MKPTGSKGNDMKTRAQIILKAKRTLAEIDQYFTDVGHWNDVRGKGASFIEADPSGRIHHLQAALLDMLIYEERNSKPEGGK
jgi:hypothetical protein